MTYLCPHTQAIRTNEGIFVNSRNKSSLEQAPEIINVTNAQDNR